MTMLIAILSFPSHAAAQLPEAIPLFPLPDVTLFPNGAQPFHIFEQRYRDMIADALAGDSIIGMVALQPGFEADYNGRPPVYAVGCAGVIVTSERLSDGRYNIVLRGLTKFRVTSEDASRTYRLASVESVPESLDESDRPALTQRRRQLEAAVTSAYPGAPLPPSGLSDVEFVDGLALILPMAPAERQEILEADGPLQRASALIARLRGLSSV
jgi:Lon protease-like protein